MVSVGSLPVNGQQLFDLETQSGVMNLLASVRASELTSDKKSDLRDLIFLYTNGGRDASVRIALEQKISALNIAPVTKKAPVAEEPPKKEEPPQPTIGKFRSAPSFRVHVTSSTTPPATLEPQALEPTVTPVPPTEPYQPPASPATEVVTDPIPEPIVPPVVEPVSIPVAPTRVPEPAPLPEVSAVPVATMAHPVDDKQYLDRIREIKASVNEKVGNPVNLVDINNEVGREYMGAILDAMKKLNSGTSAGSAMKRLEEAYAEVLRTLEARELGIAAQIEESPQPAVEAEVPVVAEPITVQVPVETYQPPVQQAPEPVFEPAPAPYVPPMPEPYVSSAPEPEPEPIPVYTPPVSEVYQSETPQYQPLGGTQKTGKLAIEDVTPPMSQVAPAINAAVPEVSSWASPAAPILPSAPFVPLSDVQEKPLSIDDLPTSESLKSAAIAGDPLFSEDVDEGLNQLLLEWSIFKKSGMFGTGPKGKDHPLFKKMALLNIPLILAGRFEGATQEIKQSVTDYMNGWRYEQGLIYQQNETFEHYLRRVIRHILDLQKGRLH